MRIPVELIEELEQGNVLLFIGERVVRNSEGQVTLDQLTSELVTRAGMVTSEVWPFPVAL